MSVLRKTLHEISAVGSVQPLRSGSTSEILSACVCRTEKIRLVPARAHAG